MPVGWFLSFVLQNHVRSLHLQCHSLSYPRVFVHCIPPSTVSTVDGIWVLWQVWRRISVSPSEVFCYINKLCVTAGTQVRYILGSTLNIRPELVCSLDSLSAK